MIHPEVQKLLQEVFGSIREDKRKLAEEYPEACLVSLLESIKADMPEVSAMLDSTVKRGAYDSSVKEVIQRFGLQKTNQCKQDLNHVGKKSKKQIKRRHLEKVGA